MFDQGVIDASIDALINCSTSILDGFALLDVIHRILGLLGFEHHSPLNLPLLGTFLILQRHSSVESS